MPAPEGVTMNEAQIRSLIGTYRSAIAKIESDINSVTSFERARRAQVLRQIRIVLGNLQDEVNNWADTNIKQYYLDGIQEAEKGLRNLGVNPTATLAPFTVIDQKAVAALVGDVKLGFAESIRGVGRSAQRVISEAERMEIQKLIAEGTITGAARREIAGSVKQLLSENGLAGLVDKSGRQWQLDTYSEMLVRTKAVEARNGGLGNRLAQYGLDLVQVSDHGSKHPACAQWEGDILSYTGNTPGYPTYDEAIASGLFHPNCEHAINVVDADKAESTNAYDNPYENFGNDETPEGRRLKAQAAFQPADSSGKVQNIPVFRGEGKDVFAGLGTNMFGDATYVSRKRGVAETFGDVAKFNLSIKPGEILKIRSQDEYDALTRAAIAANPTLDLQKSIPKYVQGLGYKAVEGTENFDELAGIAVYLKNLLS